MLPLRFLALLLLTCLLDCSHPGQSDSTVLDYSHFSPDDFLTSENSHKYGRGALLLSKFNSFDEFQSVVQIDYIDNPDLDSTGPSNSEVRLTHRSAGRQITSILTTGISEIEFINARDGTFWDRVRLGLNCPYAVIVRGDLLRVEILARRRYRMFGEGDVAFYDLAETMVQHINAEDVKNLTAKDLSEKGYLNTFNHVTAQAFLTSIFSEKLADFMADTHERYYAPDLITGKFTEDQLQDLENGAVDNYLDLINNEWGQELGKLLQNKYKISRSTYWTPELLSNYLNDIQRYNSWAFQIGFTPFRATDQIVVRFSDKINKVFENITEFRKHYY